MHALAVAELPGARDGSKKVEAQNPILKVADWVIHLEREIDRLDVKAGVNRMCKVTGRFTALPQAFWKYKRSAQEIAAKVRLVYPEKHNHKRKTWPNLITRATSTYAKIAEWLEHKDVDVLSQSRPGVSNLQRRSSKQEIVGGHRFSLESLF